MWFFFKLFNFAFFFILGTSVWRKIDDKLHLSLFLPHVTLCVWVHGLAGSTVEHLGKVFRVLDRAVDAPFRGRVRISAELEEKNTKNRTGLDPLEIF